MIGLSKIGSGDTVIDIGAGRGIITAELARHAKRVIAIEKDPRLIRSLRSRFGTRSNVEIVQCDFLQYRLPGKSDHKVFANIPYNRTAAIVRKLLDRPDDAPLESFLIMQKEPAKKFAGVPRETLFSLLAKPYFEFRIMHHLHRTDFRPVPDVDSVLLRITRKTTERSEIVKSISPMSWPRFVTYGFTRYKPNLRLAYKNIFTYKHWKYLARELGFPINATPSELTFEQWLGLFRGLQKGTQNSAE